MHRAHGIGTHPLGGVVSQGLYVPGLPCPFMTTHKAACAIPGEHLCTGPPPGPAGTVR